MASSCRDVSASAGASGYTGVNNYRGATGQSGFSKDYGVLFISIFSHLGDALPHAASLAFHEDDVFHSVNL